MVYENYDIVKSKVDENTNSVILYDVNNKKCSYTTMSD